MLWDLKFTLVPTNHLWSIFSDQNFRCHYYRIIFYSLNILSFCFFCLKNGGFNFKNKWQQKSRSFKVSMRFSDICLLIYLNSKPAVLITYHSKNSWHSLSNLIKLAGAQRRLFSHWIFYRIIWLKRRKNLQVHQFKECLCQEKRGNEDQSAFIFRSQCFR